MSTSYSAYVAYGIEIPISPYGYDDSGCNAAEIVDKTLAVETVKAACPNVGHLQAGAYDLDRFFLVTSCHEAEIGQVRFVGAAIQTERGWDEQIKTALQALGWDLLYPDLLEPDWFVICDES